MVVYFDELSSEVRTTPQKFLRLKRLREGAERGEYAFQTVIADVPQQEAHLIGNIVVEADEALRTINWETFYPSDMRESRTNPAPLRRQGI